MLYFFPCAIKPCFKLNMYLVSIYSVSLLEALVRAVTLYKPQNCQTFMIDGLQIPRWMMQI